MEEGQKLRGDISSRLELRYRAFYIHDLTGNLRGMGNVSMGLCRSPLPVATRRKVMRAAIVAVIADASANIKSRLDLKARAIRSIRAGGKAAIVGEGHC